MLMKTDHTLRLLVKISYLVNHPRDPVNNAVSPSQAGHVLDLLAVVKKSHPGVPSDLPALGNVVVYARVDRVELNLVAQLSLGELCGLHVFLGEGLAERAPVRVELHDAKGIHRGVGNDGFHLRLVHEVPHVGRELRLVLVKTRLSLELLRFDVV